jgi:hypothetical protein
MKNININPPGVWEETIDGTRWKFYNPEIGAVYGLVFSQVREGIVQKFNWYWEARTLLETREVGLSGYAPTPEAGKRIVETLLRETLTVEFPEYE